MGRFFPFVACLALLATVCGGNYLMGVLAPVSVMAQSADDLCVVSTPSGRVRGLQRGAACAYLGVPYATPPVGNLRWKPPQPMAPWAPAVLDSVSPPPTCPLINPPTTGQPTGSEDCLKLNIWAPAHLPGSRAPVIVWFHTGGFQAASANLQPPTANVLPRNRT